MRRNYYNILWIAIILPVLLLSANSCSSDDDNPAAPTTKSNEKKITSFMISNLTPAVSGIIDNSTMTITATVPALTDLTTLIPIIAISEKAAITPASGIAQDFSNPVIYTVTAEDGSKAQYTATISLSNEGPLTLSGEMNENRVLKNRGDGIDYIVDGYLSIAGNALLTIEAGVKIAFTGVDGEIVVEENAGIKITGTSENPVIFTGPVNNQNPGAWRGIRLRSNRSDNVWNYVVIENAGIDNGEGALILDYEAQLSLKNSRISGSLSNGIYLFDNAKFLAFENNVINTCAKPITCYRFGQVAKFDMSSDFSNNVVNLITVNNESIESNLTIHEINIPYLAAGSIWLGNATLTIEAGVNIAFDSGTYIYVNEDGIIKANGNAQKPIRLYGKNQQAGFWKGLEIVSTHDNALSYCTIEHGGMNDYADLKIEYAKLSLENCSFRHSANFGIILSNYTELSHTGNSFTDCKNGNVYNSDEDVVTDNLP